MRLSQERINALQKVLKDQYDLELSDEEAQEAGLSIMRFVKAKYLRKQELNNNQRSNDNGQGNGNNQLTAKSAN